MIKVEVKPDFINPNEELTKEKCLEYIQHINQIIKETRVQVYNLFLGKRSLNNSTLIVLASFVLYFIFDAHIFLTLALVELIGYFVLSIIMSEYLNNKLKTQLIKQRNYFKEKLKQFS